MDMSRSVIEKKFKIDDGKSKFYMEQSTMLEPGNTGSQWEDEEEMREISTSLGKLKKKYDVVKKEVVAMEEKLDKLNKDIKNKGTQATKAEQNVYEANCRVDQIKEAIQTTKDKNEEENMYTFVYAHMVDRMKKDQIALEVKRNIMEGSLRNKEGILTQEIENKRKIKEAHLQAKYVFDSLMKNISDEQNERKKRIGNMNRSIRNKEENVLSRERREKHQRDIAESAANESKDATEKKMRQNFMLHKLWNAFMRQKMEREMKASAHIDEAFKKIKTATGVTDVQELVHKFLSRDGLTDLLVAVTESEQRIDSLRKENEDLRGRLRELKIDSEGQEEDDEISKLKDEQDAIKREDAVKREKYYSIEINNDLIYGWARRIVTKIDENYTHEKASDAEIVEIFKHIADKVCDLIQTMGFQDEAPKSNLMNDFLTDDFVNKNIRVRPNSGKTQEEGKEMRSHGSKALMHTDAQEEIDEEQYFAIELEDQRKGIKQTTKDWEESITKKIKQDEKDKKR